MENFDIPKQKQEKDSVFKEETSDIEEEFRGEKAKIWIEAALAYGQKCNEGQNAIIYRLNISDIPRDIQERIFGKDNLDVHDKYATKIIKVHGGITAETESNNQRQAYDIIESQSEEKKATLAKVPKVYVDTNIEVSEGDILDKLTKDGVRITKGQAEVFIMDYIKGDDLATHLFKRLLKEMPEEQVAKDGLAQHVKRQLEIDSEQVSFEEIHSSIQSLLKLEQTSPLAPQDEMLKVEGNNKGKIFDALKRYGIVLDKNVLIKVENTLKLFHENNLYHNDLHERNIMVVLDDDGNLIDVYIIDYDKVADKQDEDLGSDKDIVREYTVLTKTQNERNEELANKDILASQKMIDKIKSRDDKWSNIEEYINSFLNDNKEGAASHFDGGILSLSSTNDWRSIGGIVLELAKKDPEKAIEYIDYKIDKSDTPAYFQKLLRSIKADLE